MILKPKNRAEWLKARREQGIGGSEAGVVLNLNPYKSPVQLWTEKVGLAEPDDLSENAAVQYGKAAEEHIRALFALDYPEYRIDYHEFWIYAQDDRPWLFATLDGEITCKNFAMLDGKTICENCTRGILEVKTCTIQNKAQWDEWDNKIPAHYFAQVLHQLAATGWDFVILRAYIRYHKDGEIRATVRDYRIDRADYLPDVEHLIKKEEEFIGCVRSRTQPKTVIKI